MTNHRGIAAEVTYSMAAAGLAGIALLQLLACMRGDQDYAFGNALGAATCATASLHYFWMRASEDETATRYSDWYVTTLLMLVEFFALADALDQTWWLVGCCAFNEVALLCGHVATIRRKEEKTYLPIYWLGVASGLGLAACFLVGTAGTPNPWMYVFAFAWTIYPPAFFVPSPAAYNLLDIFSKGAFGFTLAMQAL